MNKLFFIISIFAVVLGTIFIGGGIWGIIYTYQSVADEKITTTADSSIPNIAVRGPLTLKAQADIIRAHTLRNTDGKTFAEMPSGPDRDIWITATTLRTALYLGITSYALSTFALALGLAFILIGIIFYILFCQACKIA